MSSSRPKPVIADLNGKIEASPTAAWRALASGLTVAAMGTLAAGSARTDMAFR